MAVDLNNIAQIAVVDTKQQWGYFLWDAIAGIVIDPGTGTGTITGQHGTHTITAADPAAKVAAPLTSDAPYQPDAQPNPDAPPNPDVA